MSDRMLSASAEGMYVAPCLAADNRVLRKRRREALRQRVRILSGRKGLSRMRLPYMRRSAVLAPFVGFGVRVARSSDEARRRPCVGAPSDAGIRDAVADG